MIRVTRWTKGPLKGEEKEEGGGIGIEGEEKLEVNEKKKEEKRPTLFWQSVYIYRYLYGPSGHKPRKLLAIKTINMTKVASRQE